MKTEIKITNDASVCTIDIEGVIGVPENEQFSDSSHSVATYERLRGEIDKINSIKAKDMNAAKFLLMRNYTRVEEDEAGYLRVYDNTTPDKVAKHLYDNGVTVTELGKAKIGLEEYYIDLMKEGK